MIYILSFILGLIPGFFWLWYVYRKDKYQREPIGLVIRIVFFGAISIVPAIIFEELFDKYIYPMSDQTIVGSFVVFFFGVGPIEELCKFFACISIYWHKAFDEPIDGIVYASASAVGFATVENILYIISSPDVFSAFSIFIARFLLATIAHIFFACMWGYNLGKKKMKIRGSIILGLLLAMFLHGTYNFVLTHSVLTSSFLLPLMIVMYLMMRGRLKRALSLSSFRPLNHRLIRCPFCHNLSVYHEGLCVICGKVYKITKETEARCPSCGRLIDIFVERCPNEKCKEALLAIPGFEGQINNTWNNQSSPDEGRNEGVGV
ncbi:MAG: PrsW family glutamic-type intramembrane protease [bacterium]